MGGGIKKNNDNNNLTTVIILESIKLYEDENTATLNSVVYISNTLQHMNTGDIYTQPCSFSNTVHL